MSDEPKTIATTEQVPITSLAELTALCQEKKTVKFIFNDKPCAVEVRKLTPAEDAKIAEIVESVVPPVERGRVPEEDRVNGLNPEYIKKRADAVNKARALGLYWAVPMLNQGKSGLTNPDDICSFVQGQLTEPILVLLWNGIRYSGVEGESNGCQRRCVIGSRRTRVRCPRHRGVTTSTKRLSLGGTPCVSGRKSLF
jgi:hypothetical protein